MASKLVTNLIIDFGSMLGGVIRRGQPLPTICGTVLGAGLGSLSGLILLQFILPGVLLGALCGAVLTAVIFRKPPEPEPGIYDDALGSEGAFDPGDRVAGWTSVDNDVISMALLHKNAIYVGSGTGDATWLAEIERMQQGAAPSPPLFQVVPFRNLAWIEFYGANSKTVYFHFKKNRDKMDYTLVFLESPQARDDMLAAVEQQFSKPFHREEHPLPVLQSLMWPLILLVVVILLFAGAAGLAAHWTAHPPPPPLGKAEQDDMVKLFIAVGPLGILLASIVPLALIGGWGALRVFSPPVAQRLHVASSS